MNTTLGYFLFLLSFAFSISWCGSSLAFRAHFGHLTPVLLLNKWRGMSASVLRLHKYVLWKRVPKLCYFGWTYLKNVSFVTIARNPDAGDTLMFQFSSCHIRAKNPFHDDTYLNFNWIFTVQNDKIPNIASNEYIYYGNNNNIINSKHFTWRSLPLYLNVCMLEQRTFNCDSMFVLQKKNPIKCRTVELQNCDFHEHKMRMSAEKKRNKS